MAAQNPSPLLYEVNDLKEKRTRKVSPEELQAGLATGRYIVAADTEFDLRDADGNHYRTKGKTLRQALDGGFSLEGTQQYLQRFGDEAGIVEKAKQTLGQAGDFILMGAPNAYREQKYGRDVIEAEREAFKTEKAIGTGIGLVGSILASGGVGTSAKGATGAAAKAASYSPASLAFRVADDVGLATEKALLKQFGNGRVAKVLAKAGRYGAEGLVEETSRSAVENITRAAFDGREEYSVEALVGDTLQDGLSGLGWGAALGGLGGAAMEGVKATSAVASRRLARAALGAEAVSSGFDDLASGVDDLGRAAGDTAEGAGGFARGVSDVLNKGADILEGGEDALRSSQDDIAQFVEDITPDLKSDSAWWRGLDIKSKKELEKLDPNIRASAINKLRQATEGMRYGELGSRQILEKADGMLKEEGARIGAALEEAGHSTKVAINASEMLENARNKVRSKLSEVATGQQDAVFDELSRKYKNFAGDILDTARKQGESIDYLAPAKAEYDDLLRMGGKRIKAEGRELMDDIIQKGDAHGVLSLVDEAGDRVQAAREALAEAKLSADDDLIAIASENYRRAKAGFAQLSSAKITASKDRSKLFRPLLSPNEIAFRLDEGKGLSSHVEVFGRDYQHQMEKIIEASDIKLDVAKSQEWRQIGRGLKEKGTDAKREAASIFYDEVTAQLKDTLGKQSPEALKTFNEATSEYAALKVVTDALEGKIEKFGSHRPISMGKALAGFTAGGIGSVFGPIGAGVGTLVGFAGGQLAKDRSAFMYAKMVDDLAKRGVDIDSTVKKGVTKLIEASKGARKAAAKGARAAAKVADTADTAARGARKTAKGAAKLARTASEAAGATSRAAQRASAKASRASALKDAQRLVRQPLLRLGHDDDAPEAQKRRVEISELVRDPQKMANIIKGRLGIVGEADPETLAKLTEATARAISYLDSIAPEMGVDEFGRPNWRAMSDGELSSFVRSYRAVMNPKSAIDDLANGAMSFEAADALRNVYPGIYNKILRETVQPIIAGVWSPSYEQRNQLSILFGKPMHETLQPDFIAVMQATAGSEQKQEQQQAQPSAPGRGAGGVRLTDIDDLKLGKARQTGSQALERIDQ